ncbi:MAG TPA: NepR family anti-sigma factor [Sphingomonas sp.]
MAPEVKKTAKPPKRTGTGNGLGDANVGQALRSAYQRTVNEDIPADLLDLLGKLD